MSCLCFSDDEDDIDEPAYKRSKHETFALSYDTAINDFPLDNGQTLFDYCPNRCSICLMGILKTEAKAGPCVTHVFHRDCIERWICYTVRDDRPPSCPNCLTEYKNAQNNEKNEQQGGNGQMVER